MLLLRNSGGEQYAFDIVDQAETWVCTTSATAIAKFIGDQKLNGCTLSLSSSLALSMSLDVSYSCFYCLLLALALLSLSPIVPFAITIVTTTAKFLIHRGAFIVTVFYSLIDHLCIFYFCTFHFISLR